MAQTGAPHKPPPIPTEGPTDPTCPNSQAFVPPQLTQPGDPYYPHGWCIPAHWIYNAAGYPDRYVQKQCFPDAPFPEPPPPGCNPKQYVQARTRFLIMRQRRNNQLFGAAPPAPPEPTPPEIIHLINIDECVARLPNKTGQCASQYWINGMRVDKNTYIAHGLKPGDESTCNPCLGK